MLRTGRSPNAYFLLCLLWGAGILLGLYKVTAYSNTSEPALSQPGHWPADTVVTRPAGRPTLIGTLHPHCVCSRATVEELARLLAQVPAPLQVEVLLYQPDTEPESWSHTDLAARVRSLPNVSVRLDTNGREAERFNMTISGHVALYAPDGRLLFTGGITQSRGHAGDNAGRSAIVSLLSGHPPPASRTPVFGCSIKEQK